MAEQLNLVRGYDFASDQGTVSLINGTDGFDVAYQGWTPQAIPERDGLVREALTLQVAGTAVDQLAASLQKLADKAREASLFHESAAERYAVWFRVQLDGESKARQSLVYSLEHQMASSVYDATMRRYYHVNNYSLGIERAPWWEATQAGTITAGSIDLLGGTFSYSTVAGDLPARIAQVRMTFSGGTFHPFPYGKAWLGFRSNHFGTATNFARYWPLGAPQFLSRRSGAGTAVANTNSDAGTVVQWGGGTANTFVTGLTLQNVTAYPGDQIGEYLVLLRASVAGTANYNVQLRALRANDITSEVQVYPRINIAATEGTTDIWRIHELAVITIPGDLVNMFGGSANIYYTLDLYAQRNSGNAAIWFDSLYLVPTEGLVHIGKDDVIINVGFGSVSAYARRGPDDRLSSAIVDTTHGSVPTNASIPTVDGGLYPGDSGIAVLVATANYQSKSKLKTKSIAVEYFSRWKEMRGND